MSDQRKPAEILGGLIRAELEGRNWTPEIAAKIAKEKKLGKGFSANNIRAYSDNARPRKPKPAIIREFESLFNIPENTWVQKTLRRETDQELLREKKRVVEEQRQLGNNDEVWIISCRSFLEATDAEINRLVCESLRKGVVYNYFYPAKLSNHSYGEEARLSYEAFRKNLRNVSPPFKQTPQIYGFSLDPQRFSYFSRLQTIVRYKRHNGPSVIYCYVEIAKDGGEGEHGVWYPLPAHIWSQIENELRNAVYLVADSQLSEVKPTNPNLHSIRQQYILWFNSGANAAHYSNLRGLIAQTTDYCVSNIIEEILPAEVFSLNKTDLRYLDVGCGDGRMTFAIIQALQTAIAATPVRVTALDPSPAQITLAKESLRTISRVEFVASTFEDYVINGQQHEFDIITAIHSLYTVDDAFLPRMFDMLAPGGIVCIWMGTLFENVINSLASHSDKVIRPSQKRNYAEEVERVFKRSTLNQLNSIPHRSSLILKSDSTLHIDNEESIIKFCALQQETVDQRLRSAWIQIKESHPDLPITDFLITIKRPNTLDARFRDIRSPLTSSRRLKAF